MVLTAHRCRLLLSVLTDLAVEEVRSGGARLRPGGVPEGVPEGAASRERAVRLRSALERLGPLYVKLGQVLSTRQDLVPEAVAAELESLHDRTTPLPFACLEPVLEEELGPGWRERFSDLDTRRPLGAASVAQTHAARLRDGRPVVVKVQRPGVRAVMSTDMRLLSTAVRLLARRTPLLNATVDFSAMLHVVFDAMRHELDFTLEAANMDAARRAVAPYGLLRVPETVLVTPRVLVQTRAPGVSIRDADAGSLAPEVRGEIGGQLLTFMCQQYLLDRAFHADPHPGNVFVAPDGVTTLIDWGMVGRIDRHLSLALAMTLLGLAANDAQIVARNWPEMGRPMPWADLAGFHQDMTILVPALHNVPLERLRFGASLASLLKYSTARGIQTNPMIGLLSKSFSNIEGSVRLVAPRLSVTEVLVRSVPRVVRAFTREALSEQHLGYQALQALALGENLLRDLRTVTRSLAGGELTVQIMPVQRRFSLAEHHDALRHRRLTRAALAASALWWWRRRR
ncbi:ABC1 kinase family protein [Streptomyces sp. CA-181903]|uniref:ABC1 kinase family protein n=1 Tax=Streptomyces sp. CA-181903 TaxID=3240055 RepID=UPI003D94B092